MSMNVLEIQKERIHSNQQLLLSENQIIEGKIS